MSRYTINRYDKRYLTRLEEKTLNSQYSLRLLGRGYNNYGETLYENAIHLMEHFNGAIPPGGTILEGQLWYDAVRDQLRLATGDGRPTDSIAATDQTDDQWKFVPVQRQGSFNPNRVAFGATKGLPSNTPGELYFDEAKGQLYVSSNRAGDTDPTSRRWRVVGPPTEIGVDIEAKRLRITDSANVTHDVLGSVVQGRVTMIWSDLYIPAVARIEDPDNDILYDATHFPTIWQGTTTSRLDNFGDLAVADVEPLLDFNAGRAASTGPTGYDLGTDARRWRKLRVIDIDADGNLNVDGTSDLHGAVHAYSTLTVDGATELNSTLHVDGVATFESQVWMNSGLDVDGHTELNSTLHVDGESTFESKVWMNNELDVDGATELNSTLGVDGVASFRSNVGIAGTLEVNGHTELNSTLNVDGAATVQGSFTANSTAWLNGDTVTRHVYPQLDSSYELGLSNRRWRKISTQDIDAKGIVTDYLTANNDVRVKGDLRVDGHLRNKAGGIRSMLYVGYRRMSAGGKGGTATYTFDFANWFNDYVANNVALPGNFIVVPIVQYERFRVSNPAPAIDATPGSMGDYAWVDYNASRPTYLNGVMYQMNITLGSTGEALDGHTVSYSTGMVADYIIWFLGGPEHDVWNTYPNFFNAGG